MLKKGYFVRKMQALQVFNSINLGIRNANYCFRNEHKHIYGNFKCIIVLLKEILKAKWAITNL